MNPQKNVFTNKDLIELASLDVLGLLDGEERTSFDAAFAAAPEAIKEMVRAQQARTAMSYQSLLPDVASRPLLRDKTLASIGVAVRADASPVAGRIVPGVVKARGVARFWRAAAIGCMAAAVLFGVVTMQLWSQFKSLEGAMRDNQVADAFLKEFGPRFEQALMNEKTQFVQFTGNGSNAGTQSMAVLLLDPETKTGQFFCKGLPTDISAYELSLVDNKGQLLSAVLHFQPVGNLVAQQDVKLDKSLDLDHGASFVIRSADQSKTVLTSKTL